MKKIELVCIGGLKFKGLKEIEKNYLQKINYYVKFTLKNLKDVKNENEELVKKKEGEMIVRVLDQDDFVVALDPGGQKMDSIGFADFIGKKLNYFAGRLVFLIGGYAGLSNTLDSRINLKISFSDMTFSHDIFRILFMEQLYRALTIIKGKKYHR